ncbi:MAG TPA: NfeD family protein [Steroidobacteraceae bacterium]|jgi:membrane protein implicated in regulation of membrane protease activity|nr:NfeD family protein [Steroidobacteraceae bacterium]
MNYFLQHLDWWHWMVLAVLLAAAETLVPGAVCIWFAAAAAVIGLLLVVIPIPWQWQLIGFGVLGLAALLAFRSYRKRFPQADEQPNLNQRGQQYVGSELVLVEPIEHGSGKAKLGDGVWKVSGPELPAGARVRVVGVDGVVLKVIPA